MFQIMFKAPNVPNFTAKEKFEREKRKERIYDRGGQNDDFRPLAYTLGGGAWGAGTNM
jgi:hypothetical protein